MDNISLLRILTWGINNMSINAQTLTKTEGKKDWLEKMTDEISKRKLIDFRNLTEEQAYDLGFKKWDTDDNLFLIPHWLYNTLPKGLELTTINGDKVIVGKDYIDNDVRFGALAYGIEIGDKPEPKEEESNVQY